uniref:transcription factor bHLH68 n=1 Tax=Erigeron canadensis TaxID=72917 RepID=UPI001CB9CE67|nr:transcription factor bHLH68 [Erigeron canadensis]
MNRGNVLQSSSVQQMLSGCPNSWWSMMTSSRPFPPHPSLLPPPPRPSSSVSQWHHDNQDHFPDSLSQLLMGGLDEKTASSYMQQVRKLENWEEQLLHGHRNVSSVLDSSSVVKQELLHSVNCDGSSYNCHGKKDDEFHGGVKPNISWSNTMMLPVSSSSTSSCISSLSNNFLDFSTKQADHGRHPPPDRSSECDSTATGGASKKAKVQPSSNSQATFKVRKEKLGDRITALHQLVSPFGKTDTASVLLEAIGYIRFLHSQIEALSLPYLGSESVDLMRCDSHLAQQRERNCLYPEDPGQLLNDNSLNMKGSALDQDSHDEPEKDLKSKGLCLVPVSCTMQVGSDNGADYWAPALNGGFR